jgi:hypothetical protein
MKIESITMPTGEDFWLITFKNTITGLEESFLRRKKELSTLSDDLIIDITLEMMQNIFSSDEITTQIREASKKFEDEISEETGYVKNKEKIIELCNYFNSSPYQKSAQNFLLSKHVKQKCEYHHSVYNVSTKTMLSHIFIVYTPDIAYAIKVAKDTVVVSEWYSIDQSSDDNQDTYWYSLDMQTGEKIEYYKPFTSGEDIKIVGEQKIDYKTSKILQTNYFYNYKELNNEQKELIKDLPYKESIFSLQEKPYGVVVEFLTSWTPWRDVYDDGKDIVVEISKL